MPPKRETLAGVSSVSGIVSKVAAVWTLNSEHATGKRASGDIASVRSAVSPARLLPKPAGVLLYWW